MRSWRCVGDAEPALAQALGTRTLSLYGAHVPISLPLSPSLSKIDCDGHFRLRWTLPPHPYHPDHHPPPRRPSPSCSFSQSCRLACSRTQRYYRSTLRERERERERDLPMSSAISSSETQTQTQTGTDRQRHRQTNRQTDKQTHTHTHTPSHELSDIIEGDGLNLHLS